MTVSNNYAPDVSAGNGVTTQFSGSWNVIAAAYMVVQLYDTVAKTYQTLTQGGGADYTLAFTSSGYTITCAVAPATGKNVIRSRNVSLDQNVGFKTSTGFQGLVEENSFDKITAMVQDLQQEINQTLLFPNGFSLLGVLPIPADGFFPVWSGTGGTMINSPVSISDFTTDVAEVATNAANSAASASAAASSAAAASGSASTATAEAVIATAQAVIATAKAVATAADRVQTGLDVISTGTNATTATTQAGLAATAKSACDTDKSACDADVVLTHADVVLTHADVVSTHADVVTTGTNATTSTTQATNASASATSAAASAAAAAAAAAGISMKSSCRVATTGALTVTYLNGALGVGATLTNAGAQAAIALDGVTLAVNDRVLVKNQAAPAQNGIYFATTLGDGTHNWVLTRSTDYDQAAEVLEGTATIIEEGTMNTSHIYVMTDASVVTMGTSSIDFTSLTANATSANTLTTPRAIYGNNFDGSAALNQIIASTYGGTGNGFTKFSGATTSEKTKTVRDASDTILELGGSYTPTGTWTNMSLVTPALGTPASGVMSNCTSATKAAGSNDTNLATDAYVDQEAGFIKNTVTVTANAGSTSVSFKENDFSNSSAATMAITCTTASAKDGQPLIVRIYDFSAVAQTIGWTNTENSTVSVPTTSNGSTTLPLTVGFMYNGATSKWRCVAVS